VFVIGRCPNRTERRHPDLSLFMNCPWYCRRRRYFGFSTPEVTVFHVVEVRFVRSRPIRIILTAASSPLCIMPGIQQWLCLDVARSRCARAHPLVHTCCVHRTWLCHRVLLLLCFFVSAHRKRSVRWSCCRPQERRLRRSRQSRLRRPSPTKRRHFRWWVPARSLLHVVAWCMHAVIVAFAPLMHVRLSPCDLSLPRCGTLNTLLSTCLGFPLFPSLTG
jgi:hypothetical protein